MAPVALIGQGYHNWSVRCHVRRCQVQASEVSLASRDVSSPASRDGACGAHVIDKRGSLFCSSVIDYIPAIPRRGNNMPSKVFFGSARQARLEAKETLPAKLDLILEQLHLRER